MAQSLDELDMRSAPAPIPDERTVEIPQDDSPDPQSAPDSSWVDAEVEVSIATHQAYQILYYAFIGLFTVVGLDKFLRLLNTWEQYVAPSMASFLHMSPGAVTLFAGIIELLAAVSVALKPRIGSWVVTAWLWLIVINLMLLSGHYDLVVSDLMLSAAGLAFTRLAAECN